MRRVAWLIVLVGLGGLGIWLGAPDPETVRAAWARLAGTPIAAVAIVAGGAIGLVLAEALRIGVIARLVGARVGVRDAIDAAVANHVMTAITPQVGLGEPTVAYLLGKRGIAWDAAVAIPFLKFTTSLAQVFLIGAALVIAGLGPPVEPAVTAAAIALFLAIAMVTCGVLALCARPPLARRVIAAVHRWLARRRLLRSPAWQDRLARGAEVATKMIDRLAGLRRTGARGVLVLAVVHLIYYAAYVAPLVGLALVLAPDVALPALFARALVYLCFVFAMPTPGGAGPSEAAAGVFFGDLVAPTDAIVVVAVFRAATFYLQLALGVLYLPLAAALRRRRGGTIGDPP